MGYFLDLQAGSQPRRSVPSSALTERLKEMGFAETEDGVWWLKSVGVATVYPENELTPDATVLCFRLSWASSPEEVRATTYALLEICNRLGLRLYDGQIEKHITVAEVEDVVDSLADGQRRIAGVPPLDDRRG